MSTIAAPPTAIDINAMKTSATVHALALWGLARGSLHNRRTPEGDGSKVMLLTPHVSRSAQKSATGKSGPTVTAMVSAV